MENQLATTCQTCFRPQLDDGSQPPTQWISFCRCNRPYLPNTNFSIDLCAHCKKRIPNVAVPKNECLDVCSCQNPDPKKVATYIKQNEADSIILELETAGLTTESFPTERYSPLALLGNKSRATAVLSRDKQRGTKVVVKIFKNILPPLHATFQSEAKKNQQLSHTNIAKITDIGVNQNKTPYLVTEYKDGFNLEQYVKLYGLPSDDVVVKILLGICEILIYAQKQGLAHKNLRPANIIFLDDLNSQPSICLVDFALPKIKASEVLTDPYDALYISGEEARGLDYSEKSEIYSIGCIGFLLLTGRPPFQGGSALDIKNMHALKLPPRISSINFNAERPKDLEEIIERCMEKDSNARFESLAKLQERLEVFPRREKQKIDAVLADRKKREITRIALIVCLLVAMSAVGYFILRPH